MIQGAQMLTSPYGREKPIPALQIENARLSLDTSFPALPQNGPRFLARIADLKESRSGGG